MLSITTIQDTLYAWVVAQTSRTTIWLYPNAPHPDLPYITLNIGPLSKVGEDFVVRPTSTSSGSKIWGNREFTLSINHYGDDSIQTLEQLRSSLEMPTVQEYLDTEASIAVIDSADVQNITGLLDTDYEERALLDCFFRVPNEITDTDIKIIDTLNLQKTFKNDFGGDTILVEDVTI